MYVEYGKSKSVRRIILPVIVLFGLFGFPIAGALFFIAINRMMMDGFPVLLNK